MKLQGFNLNLDNKIKIHLYRILQETMQNTYKHAKASKVDITFSLEKNTLNLKNLILLFTLQDYLDR